MTRSHIYLVASAVVVGGIGLGILLAGPADARSCQEDWPTYRGDDQRTGACGTTSGPGTGEILWSIRTEGLSIPSSPAIVDDSVYFTADQHVYAVDRYNGTIQWTYETGGGIGSSPAIVDGTLYIGSGDGHVYALDTTDGTLEWRHPTEMGINAPPSVKDGRVVVGLRSHAVLALDAATGTELWNTSTDKRITTSPLLWQDSVFIGDRGETFYAMDAGNGSIEWADEREGGIRGSSAYHEGTGMVFSPSGVGWLHALDPSDGDITWESDLGFSVLTINTPAARQGDIVATTTGDHVVSMSASEGQLRWNKTWNGSFVADPAVTAHTVYVAEHSGTVRALNASTGNLVWETSPTPLIRSSPALADGVLYVGSDNFEFFAIDAGLGPDAVERIGSAPSAGPDPSAEPTTNTSPSPGVVSVLVLLGLGASRGGRD